MNTQVTKVLRYLKRHKTITPREALMDLGVYRLAAVIYELRENGWSINTERKRNPDTGNLYASYRMA
jgi:argonaute-like protein implicated in RNA metabolism and viral defense